MTAAWVLPTARTTSWGPLLAVTGCLAVLGVPVRVGAVGPAAAADLLGPVAAALAAAAVAGLRDPAAALLAAVPVTPAARRTQRLVLVVPAAVAVWWVWSAPGLGGSPGRGPGADLVGLAALLALGLAVAVAVASRTGTPLGASAGLVVGTAVPVLWVVSARAGSYAWDAHSGVVLAAAVGALCWVRER